MGPIYLPLRYSQSRCSDGSRKWVNRSRDQVQLHLHYHPNPECGRPKPNPIPSRHKLPREPFWQSICTLSVQTVRCKCRSSHSPSEWARPPSEFLKSIFLAIDSRSYGAPFGTNCSLTDLRHTTTCTQSKRDRARHATPMRVEFTFDLRWVEMNAAALLMASQSTPSDLARLRLTMRRERYATYDSRKQTMRG